MTDLVEKAQEAANRESGRFLSRPEILTVIAAVYDDLTDADATTLETFYRAMEAARCGKHGFIDSVSVGLNAIVEVKRKEVLGDEQ